MTFVAMDNNDTPRFCMTPKFGMYSWGYCKIIINIFLLIITVDPIMNMYRRYFYDIMTILIFGLLAALVIADIVFQAKLVHGLRKNKVELLTAYCKYTRLLWIIMPMSFVFYIFASVTDIMGPIFWRHESADTLLTIMYTMLIGTILQSLIMLLVTKEIKNLRGETDDASTSSGGIRVFSFGFTIKIETSCSEKVKEEDNNKTYTEDTSEKAKLTV